MGKKITQTKRHRVKKETKQIKEGRLKLLLGALLLSILSILLIHVV